MSRTTENVIVIILMVAIVVGLLYFVGYSGIETWLSSPFVWKEPEYLSVEYVGTYYSNEDHRAYYDKGLFFKVYNNSDHHFDFYDFQVVVGDEVLELSSINGGPYPRTNNVLHSGHLEPKAYTTLLFRCNDYGGVREEFYDIFENMSSSDIQKLEYRVVKLNVGEDTVFSNNGWGKIITILVASLALGLLGFVERFPVWLRIILKVCGLPFVLFLIFCFLFGSHQEKKRKEEQRRKRR